MCGKTNSQCIEFFLRCDHVQLQRTVSSHTSILFDIYYDSYILIIHNDFHYCTLKVDIVFHLSFNLLLFDK